MIIKELLLDGFGKFDRKYIKFENGLNLFLAKNESGKTTVRKSIDAALYGFTNTDSKRKNYSDDYINYRSGNYRVKLNLINKDENISIERDLKNEISKVYLEESDRTIDYTFTNKILTPGIDLLGVGSTVYKNFFDIETDLQINNDLIDTIFSLESDTDYINKVIGLAEKDRSEIGSLNAPTKKRAILNNQINELLNKINEYDTVENEIEKLKSFEQKSDKKNHHDKKKSIAVELILILIFSVLFLMRTRYPALYIIPCFVIIFCMIRMLKIIKYNKLLDSKIDDDIESKNEFISGQISILEKYMDEKIEDIDNLNKISSELKELDYEYKLLSDAISVFEEANKIISDKPINNYISKAKEIFKIITNSDDLSLDNDFNIYLDRGFKLNLNQMSKATREIVNFSLKISCREFISNTGFILLDDAFQYLDDDRLERTVNYISSLTKDYQIILFTSNCRIKNILEKNNLMYNLVEF